MHHRQPDPPSRSTVDRYAGPDVGVTIVRQDAGESGDAAAAHRLARATVLELYGPADDREEPEGWGGGGG